ncbi:MAG: ABC-type transporter, integral rane subunit, partial [Actinomycetia bacterium]|nr:ABC-type transporter, integral rane subunit [Actinomycetes bacterium]
MAKYIGGKVVHLVLVLLLVSFATYALLDLMPGGIEFSLFGPDATPEQVANARQQLKLDDPFVVRYGRWLGHAVTGDLGRSYRDNRPVMDDITPRLPVTFELAALAMFLAVLLAIPLGVLQAYRQGRTADRVAGFGSVLLISVPQFLVAVILIAIFSIRLDWLPISGLARLSSAGLVDHLRSLALPAISLALAEAAVLSQVLRNDMISTLKEDYILSARAKGMPTRNILLRQALRPSSISLLTLAALNAGRLLGGAVIVEVLFGLPGLGKMIVDAIATNEIIKVQAGVLVIATIYVVLNAVTDVLYGFLDPR